MSVLHSSSGSLSNFPISSSSGPNSQTLMNRHSCPKTNPELLAGLKPHDSKHQLPNFLIADLTSRLNFNSSSREPVAVDQPALVGTMQTIEKPYIRLSKVSVYFPY